MKALCVYCGANRGNREEYVEAATDLAAALNRRGITAVFGGGSVGLMGVLADAVLEGGGDTIGVLPRGLFKKEVAHPGLTELHIVESMHERKAMMASLSEGFIALPGGLGTMEELFEMLSWAQLGLHAKPCGLLNIAGYFDGLVEFLDHAAHEGFIKPEHRAILMVDDDPDQLLEQFAAYRAPAVEKWIEPGTT